MPDWTGDLRRRLAPLGLSPAREAEIVDELAEHLDQRYEDLRTAGMDHAGARRLALEELREHSALADGLRPLRQAHHPPPIVPGSPRGALLPDLWQDLRYAARVLRKQPGFALAAILTLALGIGANTAIFSLINATLLRTLPIDGRDRLVYVHRNQIGSVMSYPLYTTLRDSTRTLESYAAWGGITASLTEGNATDLVSGAIVSGNLFDLLGIHALQGRLLAQSDDEVPGRHPVALVSYELWQGRFAGRSDIVGHDMRLNGHVFTIVGVTPEGFPGPQLGNRLDIYVPMMMQAIVRPPRAAYSGEQNPDLLKNPGNGWLRTIGKMHPGVAPEQVRAELGTLAANWARTMTPTAPVVQMPVVPLDEGDPNQRAQMESVALLLTGVVAAVLLIACANIANLLLSRSAARRRELAVRLAIGAGRGRIVRQLLTESVLLAVLGGIVGLGLAVAATASFAAVSPPPGALPLPVDFAIDRRVMFFSLALSCLTGLAFGLVPALRASRPGLVPALKNAAADEQTRKFNLKSGLVVAEVALAVPLLIAAGLFVRSLVSAQAIDPGIDAGKLVTAPLNINLLRYTRDQGREFYRAVVEKVEQIPGVESASAARVAVLTGGGRVLSLLIEGRDGPQERSMSEGSNGATLDPLSINANVVAPKFFQTLGIPFVAGRDFNAQDTDDRMLVTIVNETMVRTHFPNEDPLGKRVSFGGARGPWREIVGVVRDSKYASLGEPAVSVAYLPVAQNHETGMTLYVRASVPPASLAPGIRSAIQSLEGNLPVPNIETMDQTIGASLYAARLGAWLLAAFGALALLLAAIGIYGVLSFSISRRTREMGIRLALGADRRDVFLLVLRDGMLVSIAGVALGLAIAAATARSLAGFLYGVPSSDPLTFGGTTAVLMTVAFVACVVPARRAMKVSPLEAIRTE